MSERTEELQEQIEELNDADDIMMNIMEGSLRQRSFLM